MPSRRHVVSALALLGVGGCAGAPNGFPANGATSEEATGERERSVDCTAVTDPPNPAAPDDEVSPLPYPSFLDELDPDTAASFASEYEAAYATNRLLLEHDGVQSVSLRGPGVVATESVAGGSLVHLRNQYGFGVDSDDEATTEVAGDSPTYHVAYLVGDGVLARREVPSDASLGNVSMDDATVFVCERPLRNRSSRA